MNVHIKTVSFLLFTGIVLGYPIGHIMADDTQKEQAEYVPTIKDRLYNRLAKKQVKEYHLKVHQKGVKCELCHGAQNPATPPDAKTCLKCHGSSAQVAKLTEKSKKREVNPHDSPHYGQDVDCIACHKEHQKSVAICLRCHLYKFKNLK